MAFIRVSTSVPNMISLLPLTGAAEMIVLVLPAMKGDVLLGELHRGSDLIGGLRLCCFSTKPCVLLRANGIPRPPSVAC